ncbi:(2Fe-2S)-binding protein [Streptosporangium amethystogenes subsp. fukuiense]|uniref:(2Fe-2S)-binding protein n=1 Tax=Streptosporangium amethystogenes subsp. fukuiense TaxID=698418 RepID=A0ABW2T9A9_9ACTN
MPCDSRGGAPPGLLPAAPAAVAGAIVEVRTIGGYFEVEAAEAEAGWRPFTDLWTDPGVLEARIHDMAGRLGTAEHRVAASILFQGLAARLWSPCIGAVVAHDLLIDLAPGHLYWRPAPDPLPLRATRLSGWGIRDPARIAEPVYRAIMTETLEPLAAAVRRIVKIAPGLLWGNAASALVGTVGAVTRRRPDLTAKAVRLGRELLDRDLLRGTGEPTEPVPGRPCFVRRSCCLYYRLPGGGMCGDCALLPPRRPQTRRSD